MNTNVAFDLYEKSDNALIRELGERFRSYRKALHLTRNDIREKSGVSVLTQSRFENGNGGSVSFRSIVALFRSIERLEEIDTLLPEVPESLYK